MRHVAPLGTFPYTVVRGDTLYGIARKFNTTIHNIRAFNSIPGTLIRAGQVLTIPQSPPEAIIYRVKPGDTLTSIARAHRTSVKNLKDFNYLSNPDLIFPGMEMMPKK